MERTRPTTAVPIELLKMRSATTAYLAMLRDLELWAHQAADMNRLVQPHYAAQLDGLCDQVRTAMMAAEMGTPAAVGRVVAELLGER